MDGTLAVVFVVTSLTDMLFNECATGCLAQKREDAQVSVQAGAVEFQDAFTGIEAYAGYDAARSFGPFQPTFGLSVTDTGDAWVGAGFKWTSTTLLNTGPFFVETSLMPGLHIREDGPDLGGHLQFRSAIGVGYDMQGAGTVTVLYDHRSNADTQTLNPGLETLAIRYAFRF